MSGQKIIRGLKEALAHAQREKELECLPSGQGPHQESANSVEASRHVAPLEIIKMIDDLIEAARIDGWESDWGVGDGPEQARQELEEAKERLIAALSVPPSGLPSPELIFPDEAKAEGGHKKSLSEGDHADLVERVKELEAGREIVFLGNADLQEENATLRSEVERLTNLVDVLESNARSTATLLADTGRRAEAAESEVERLTRERDEAYGRLDVYIEDVQKLLDPVAVHANMLRGTIAKPSVEQVLHLYPELQAFMSALQQTRKALEIRESDVKVLTGAIDTADRIIERALGDATPDEWHEAFKRCVTARSDLSTEASR